MAAKGTNRYALFQITDENASPINSPAVNATRSVFFSQVADNSAPWEEVKKRGVPAPQRHPANKAKGKQVAIRDQAKVALAYGDNNQARARAISASTAPSDVPSDKIYDPRENWCGVCSQKFGSKVNLLNHIKQSGPDHKYYCNLCKRVLKDFNGLQNHLENSWGHEIFCNLCLSAFNDEWGLKNHFENNYAVGHEFVCLTCLMGFRNQHALQQHLQTAEKHTRCESCERRFRNQDERDEHWQKTAKHKHCLQPGCDFDGPDQATLDRHLDRDHFRCVGCKRIFQSQTKLNSHAEICAFAIACPQCNMPCAGQAQLAKHLKQCFYCEECDFATSHEGNYHIHMTKHAYSKIPCWGCDVPMRTYSSLINHLESGRCPSLHEPARLVLCLGKWWYSPLYMDLEFHAQIRTGRYDPRELQAWIDQGVLQPFMCRGEGCEKKFGLMSSLVLHCESRACGWDIARLNMPGLEKEVKQTCMRRDSGYVSR